MDIGHEDDETVGYRSKEDPRMMELSGFDGK